MIQSAVRQAAEESGMLLNQELSVEDTEVLETSRQTYLEGLEESAFVVGVESREEYSGTFYMVFSLRDAILMSGILLGIPPARISEKKKLLIVEADDVDAFSEIVNQIIGSFNSVFQPCLPRKIHLKQLPPVKFVPQMDEVTDELPFPDAEFLVYRAQMKLRGEEMNRFDILVPFPLAHLFDPVEEAPASEDVSVDTAHDQAESLRRMFNEGDGPAEGIGAEEKGASQAVLVLDEDAGDREMVKGFLAAAGFRPITASPGADIGVFFSKEAVRAVVLGTAKAEEWDLSLCSRIRNISRDSCVPIIMSARQWTLTRVLKAVKNGANDIIIKPYDESELVAKLSKWLCAA